MNLLYTFQAKPKIDNPHKKFMPEMSPHSQHLGKITANIPSKKHLPPIPSSVTHSRSERHLIETQAERINLKSDSQASRIKLNEIIQDSKISKALSGYPSKRNKIYTTRDYREEAEPKTPTFRTEDEKLEELKNLNSRIEKEYKIPFKAMKKVQSLPKSESMSKIEKPPDINAKMKVSLFSSIVSDFPFFASPYNRDLLSFDSSRFHNSEIKENEKIRALNKIASLDSFKYNQINNRVTHSEDMQLVLQNRPKVVSNKKRERPKIKKHSGSLPHGVFTIKNL